MKNETDLPLMSYHVFHSRVREFEAWLADYPCRILAKPIILKRLEEVWK